MKTGGVASVQLRAAGWHWTSETGLLIFGPAVACASMAAIKPRARMTKEEERRGIVGGSRVRSRECVVVRDEGEWSGGVSEREREGRERWKRGGEEKGVSRRKRGERKRRAKLAASHSAEAPKRDQPSDATPPAARRGRGIAHSEYPRSLLLLPFLATRLHPVSRG